MSTPIRVAAGTPVGRLLRASTINYALEGAELAHKLATGELGQQRAADRGGKVLVRNDTGATIEDRFRVLGVTGILIDPGDSDEAARSFKEHFAFTGDTPDLTRDGPGRIGITQAPVSDGKMVQCIISGPTVCYLNLPDSETYTAAAIEDGESDYLTASEDGDICVLWHEDGPGTKLAVVNLAGLTPCKYYWRFYISGGSANPSSGSQVWSVTLNADTQNVTIDFDMTAAELKTHLLAQFSGLTADDVDTRGGPLPEIALDVEWKGAFVGHAMEDYPPTVGTNTLNNSASMHMHDWNPRS